MLVPLDPLSQASHTKAARDRISTDIQPENGHASLMHLINVSIPKRFGKTIEPITRHRVVCVFGEFNSSVYNTISNSI